jgi:hypothetical protein
MQNDALFVESVAAGGWQVLRIVGERQTDMGPKYTGQDPKQPKNEKPWRYKADLDPQLLK